MSEQVIEFFVVFAFGYVALLLVSVILRPLVFLFHPLFEAINYVIYATSNPFRIFYKNPRSYKARGLFLLLFLSGVNLGWFVLHYIVTTPLRIITAVYYDVLLFLAVAFSDSIQELLNPKSDGWRHKKKGIGYVFSYVFSFPFRFVGFIFRNGIYVLDSLCMFGVSLIFPTITMKHGTKFNEAGTKIVQSGGWLVGQGNYAGTGIYFGMRERIAEYYGTIDNRNGKYACVLVRVTLTFTKTIATLKGEDRQAGLGEKGERIARNTKGILTASVEHWREDHRWWEYCILRPNEMGDFIQSWRIRPVAIINDGKIARTWGGFYHYAGTGGLIAGAISWFIIFLIYINLMK